MVGHTDDNQKAFRALLSNAEYSRNEKRQFSLQLNNSQLIELIFRLKAMAAMLPNTDFMKEHYRSNYDVVLMALAVRATDPNACYQEVADIGFIDFKLLRGENISFLIRPAPITKT